MYSRGLLAMLAASFGWYTRPVVQPFLLQVLRQPNYNAMAEAACVCIEDVDCEKVAQ